MQDLIRELKHKIVTTLSLADVDPEGIGDETSLFQDGLGLDSIDVLELVILMERDYGVKIDNKELGEKVFRTAKSMAAYIQECRGEAG